MSVSILLVHKITDFLGFHLKCKSLMLCAAMAFVVNFTTLALSSYLTTRHFMLIFAFIVVAALIVTCYNEHLLTKDRQTAGVAVTSVGTSGVSPAIHVLSPPLLPSDIMPEELSGSHHTDLPLPLALAAVPREEVISTGYTATQEPATVSKAEESPVIATGDCSTMRLPVSTLPASLVFPTEPKLSDILYRTVPSAINEFSRSKKIFHAPAVIIKTIADIVHEDMENDHLLKLTAVIAKLGSLDDILDYAFEQKTRHNYFNALFAYKRALIRYCSDDYAPFIVIDIVNIYKDNGAYEEAIHTYLNALSLPAIVNNSEIHEEFEKNLAYLRIVEYVLAKHHIARTPFGKISPNHLEEIETIFQNRRIQKIVS
jgi:hypothetical protein